MTRNATLLFAAILIISASLFSRTQAADEQKAPQTIPELEAAIRNILAATKTPGAGVAIVSREKVEWVAGIGKADVAANTDATPDTQFRIGSSAKSFTALSILKLVEQGKLSLNDTLRSLTPEIQFKNRWESTDPVRVVHLLEHTTGFDDWAWKDYASSDPKPLTLREGLDFNPSTRVARWRPGSFMSYSNSGPPLAAYIVEKISGQRFEDYVAESFFRPMRMEHASYLLTPYVEANLTKAYHGDGVTTFPYWHVLERPAGSLNVSPREMANYVRMFLNRGAFDGTKLLEPSSIDRMEIPVSSLAARQGMAFGYGLCSYESFCSSKKPYVFHGHDGGMPGARASFNYLPEQGVGFAFMINSDNEGAFWPIRDLIASYVIRDLPMPSFPAVVGISPGIAAEFSGLYELITPRNECKHFLERLTGLIRVSFDRDKFVRQGLFGGAPVKGVAVSDRLYRSENIPVATIVLIPDAGEGTMIYSAGARQTYRRIPLWFVALEIGAGACSLLLLCSAVIFSLVWIPRKLFGRMKTVRHLSLRIAPLVSALCFGICAGIWYKQSGDQEPFGQLTAWSGSLFLLSLLFALTALWGLVLLLRVPKNEVAASVWWHSLLVTAANLIVAGYLAWWGLIGIRTWA